MYKNIVFLLVVVAIGLIFSETVRVLLGAVKYSGTKQITGSIIFRKDQKNSPEGFNVTVYSASNDFTFGGLDVLEQDFGDPKYTCIMRTENGDFVEVRNEMLWGKVSTGDSIRVNYHIRENRLLGIRQPVIEAVRKL